MGGIYSMTKLSIIVPVYNVSKYLEKCVRSILNSLDDSTEVLLVDDGSTDNSGQLCDSYSETYMNVKSIHKKNGGLSSARNLGIKCASGEWVTFIDSDDTVVPHYVEIVKKIIKYTNDDIVLFKLKQIYDDKLRTENVKFHINRLKKVSKEYALYCLTRQDFGNFAVTKIYKRSLFSNIKFPENQFIYEDLAISYQILNKASTISIYDDYLYCYYIRQGSMSHGNSHNPYNYLTGVKTSYSFYQYLVSYLPSESTYIQRAIKLNNYFLFSQYFALVYDYRNDKQLPKYLKKIHFMNNMVPSIKYEGCKVYFSFLLYRLSPKLFYGIYRLGSVKKFV